MRRRLTLLLLVVPLLAGCNGDDGSSSDAASEARDDGGGDDGEAPAAHFCDVYLEYLADSTPENLEAVEAAADDPLVSEYADVIESEPSMDNLLAATLDLDDVARSRCQSEWISGAQGAGNTAAAAQAFLDAVAAGDELGARNVASANAIAVFEPWEPIPPDAGLGTPTLADVGGQSFSMVLGESSVAQCEVETGVVVACQLTG